jgi:hypothetical protein
MDAIINKHAHACVPLKGLGHKIEFKYFDKNGTYRSKLKPILIL